MTQRNWIPGPPQGEIEPDRLYAVLMQPTAGYSVGIVIRGEDCNWQKTTIGHMPLPVTMNSAEAGRLQRLGWYEIPKTAPMDYEEPKVTPDGHIWMTGAEVAEKLTELGRRHKEARDLRSDNGVMHEMIMQIRKRFNAWDTPTAPSGQDIVDCIIRHAEMDQAALQQKVAGYQVLLQQIADQIKQTPEVVAPTRLDSEVNINDLHALLCTFSMIDMLIGTFGDKPAELAPDAPAWSKGLPDEQGLWWWWNGDPDGSAIPVNIMESGTDGSFFASQGQHGWNRAQTVKEMGGLWMRCEEPEISQELRKEADGGK